MIQDMSYMIANAHTADLHREADHARLARLATRCRLTGLSGVVNRLRGREGCEG